MFRITLGGGLTAPWGGAEKGLNYEYIWTTKRKGNTIILP